jgi:hypothetical protein
MSDVEDYFQNSQLMARQNFIASQDADPEQAAESVDLASETGVPSTAIYGDLDGFKRAHKAQLGAQIIGENSYIADYLNSHPMAARVSHDDLGALDEHSRSLESFYKDTRLGQWLASDSVSKSFMAGFGQQPLAEEGYSRFYHGVGTRPNELEWALAHPELSSVLSPVTRMFGLGEIGAEALSRTTSGLLQMGEDGVDKLFGAGSGRELRAMAEWAMMRGDLGVKAGGGNASGPLARIEENTKLFKSMRDGLDIADIYPKEPPVGVHPLIDTAKKEQVGEDLKDFDDALKTAQQSVTRERAPEMFADFVRQHVGDREIGIAPEIVDKLYGDKPPTPDDGILGWVPGIESKLASARLTGEDISIPMADWLAKVDPEVAKTLHDDIRLRPDGMTLNETKVDAEPREAIAEPLQTTRGAAGLEPMFQIGDRKLTLDRKPIDLDVQEIGSDNFDIKDETGFRVGQLKATPYDNGKKLYIDWVGGLQDRGFGPNSFGPALTRSLIRQLKDAYPNLEEIGGYRVSGARDKAGKVEQMGKATIKVQDAFDSQIHQYFRNLLSQNWEDLHAGVSGLFDKEGAGLASDTPMGRIVLGELQRIAPDVGRDVAHDLTTGVGPVRGVYFPNLRKIIVGLRNEDPLNTARHEAIHGLRGMDLFSPEEWSKLEAAADADWIKRFDIDARYEKFPGSNLREEAIAEAYAHWANGGKFDKATTTLFQRIKDFFEGIRQRLNEFLGTGDLSWEQVFEKIDSGEIGSREEPARPQSQFNRRELQAQTEPSKEVAPGIPEREGIYTRGKDLGISQAHMDRMLRLIEKRNQEDFAAAQRREEVKARRRSNADWKERRTQLRDDVREQLGSRPDILTDQLFAKQKIKIDPAYLTIGQRERLPKDYVQKKDGINPDDLAPYFGYTSGDALVERLALITEDRKRAGMSQRDYFNRLVDVETDRRLNMEFGDRQQAILDEAKDQALGQTQLNLVHEETLAYALKAGQEPQFTREQVVEMVKNDFDQRPVGSISSDKLLAKAGDLGKKIEEAGAKGKWDDAYKLSQQRNHTMIAAKFARAYEKSRAQFDRSAKSLRDRVKPGIDQEYLNWIHDILQRTGYPIRRSLQDLSENIARQSETTLDEFIKAKEAFFMGMRQLDVADFLRDPAFRKPVDELTAKDFEGLRQSVKILEKAGRDEKTVNVEGAAWDRKQVMSDMRDQLETFGYDPKNATPPTWLQPLRTMGFWLTNMETLLTRWDRGNRNGLFNRVIMKPLAEAANGKAKLLREIAQNLKTLDRPKDLDKLVQAPFPDPMSPDGQGTWEGFNKGNVLMMLQNAGNKSNWNVLARGYGMDPEVLFKWLQKNVTKEDVQRAEQLGGIFKKLIARSDNVYERLTGATVEKVPLSPIEFTFPGGDTYTSSGWYHPLDRDPIRASMWKDDGTGNLERTGSRGRESAYGDADYFHAATANGYTKKRTGSIYPLNLDYNLVPTRLRQIAHDVNFREPLLNIEKIFADRLFQEDVAKYYGREYAKDLMPYLRGLAGSEGIRSENVMWANAFLEKARQNIISTYIGFNPFTVLKHGPTAAVMSSNVVGTKPFATAVAQLAKPGSAALRKFIMDNSEELQRRERHWQDTMGAQGNELSDKSTIRERVMDYGSRAVAWSDMASAMPTWWAKYQEVRADPNVSHGQAIADADTAVRIAHGSTAETNLPPAARGSNALNKYLTSVYGFFGTVMQRRIELAHLANDTYKLGREGEIRKAAANAPDLLRNFMTYVVWPTLVEEAVTGLTTEDRRGWGSHLLAGATMGLSSSVLFLRDLAYGLTTGHDPGVGLASSAMHDMANAVRDVKRGRESLNKQHAGKTVEDFLTLFGEATGTFPKTGARAIRFGIDTATGQQKPQTIFEFARGIAHGEAKRRKEH